jgi:lysophospholipase
MARAIAWTMVASGQGSSPVPGLGHDPLVDAFVEEGLTHDRGRYARYKNQLRACPDLALGGPTWGWLDFALSAIAVFADRPGLAKVDIPVTVVAAQHDRLVLNSITRQLVEAMPKGRYVEIAGAFHEILVETDDIRAQFWAAFDQLAAEVTSPPA